MGSIKELINWSSEQSQVFLNPTLPTSEQEKLLNLIKKINPLSAHIWLATSGSTFTPKMVALSKQAILDSARAVNEHLAVSAKDIWALALPHFHVGGLGIYARAYLSKSLIAPWEKPWKASEFNQFLKKERVTLTALVPTQVFDLVKNQERAPENLRAAVIGGGALVEGLWQKARELGWPLLPSFGMTECASQVATAELASVNGLDYPKLKILNHVEARVENSRLQIKSAALFSGYAQWENDKAVFIDPKEKDWWLSDDLVEIKEGYLKPLGRDSDFIKINGESLSLQYLRGLLGVSLDVALVAREDARSGSKLVLYSSLDERATQDLLKDYQERVMPIAKIKEIIYVPEIPKSALGKILYSELRCQAPFP